MVEVNGVEVRKFFDVMMSGWTLSSSFLFLVTADGNECSIDLFLLL